MRFSIRHETRYSFPEPVQLGPHQIMMRPRDSHDLRLLNASLTLNPSVPVIWSYDVFGNSIGLIDWDVEATELTIISDIELERFTRAPSSGDLPSNAMVYPPRYPAEERRDLGPLLHLDDEASADALERWVQDKGLTAGTDPLDVLGRLMAAIKDSFAYEARYAEGTQRASETLEKASGTCRDFALLMMEAARTLGFGARFVTGYLYSPALDGGEGDVLGAAATHAWAEIYVPGIGWTDYDPTNNIVNGADLIKVAVVRKPGQAIPVSGSFTGPEGIAVALDVAVHVVRSDGSDGSGS